jgi:hypothetical protein
MGVETASDVAGADQAAGLVRADQQRAVDRIEYLREALRADAAQRRLGGRHPARGGPVLARLPGALVARRIAAREKVAGPRRNGFGSREHGGQRLLVPAPFLGIRRGEGRGGVRERRRRLVEIDLSELGHRGERGGGVLDQAGVVDRAHPLGGQPLEVVEERRLHLRPLVGDDLGQGRPAQLAPLGRQRKRPRRTVPTRQLRIGHEPTRLPGVDHAAQGLTRLPIEIDEERPGEDRVQERDPQRVLRRLLEHPHPVDVRWQGLIRAIAQLLQEGTAKALGRDRRGVGSGQAVGVEAARRGMQAGNGLDQAVALTADGPDRR